MKRLSLAKLKAQSGNIVANLEAIKGGNIEGGHSNPREKSFIDACIDRLKKGPIVLF